MEEKADTKTRVGVMGGSFDPIHFGHLVTAEAARVKFGLDKVKFIPTARSPVKKSSVASAQERYLMTVLATATNANFEVSRMEIEREGPSYTIDTLEAQKREYGDSDKIFFIAGADAVLDILSWKDSQRFSGVAQFIAATRPGYDLSQFNKISKEARDLPQIHILEIPALAISSTDLRRRVREGLSIRYLVPGSVEAFIAKSRLYMNDG
ncbi:MAG TPA: nicotinate-nucleotide adenylyltransferase [Actinobacteria bacterium]|nr:nicotinate-nucleotide adenylyltransferase [Actinomycetota bacterium]